jgi:hypothetical protein
LARPIAQGKTLGRWRNNDKRRVKIVSRLRAPGNRHFENSKTFGVAPDMFSVCPFGAKSLISPLYIDIRNLLLHRCWRRATGDPGANHVNFGMIYMGGGDCWQTESRNAELSSSE